MPTGGIYQSRVLEKRVRQVLRARRRMLPFFGADLIPTSADLPPGTRELVQDKVLEFGEAVLMAQDADDVPLVEINAREDRYRVVMPVAGYPVKFGEVLADNVARANGIQYNPTDVRSSAVIRAIEEKCSKFTAVGDSTLEITGVLNDANVTPVNSSFDAFDAATTADEIADWFLTLVGDIFKNSNNVEYPNTALISTPLHELMTRRRMPDSSETILSYIVKTQQARSSIIAGQRLENIVPLVECGSTYLEANGVETGGTNKDRIVLYPMDQEVVEKHMMSGAISAFPDDWTINKGARKIFPMYSFLSQVIIKFPGAFSYIKHPKEA